MMSNHDDRPGGSGLLLGAGAALLMVASMFALIALGIYQWLSSRIQRAETEQVVSPEDAVEKTDD